MEGDTLQLKITTPEGQIYDAKDVVGITIPTKAGVITVYADHEPIVTLLESGEINVMKKDHTVDLSVSSGVVEIRPGSVINILAETAERAEDIDIERAEEARKRAEEYLQKAEDIADVDFTRMQAKIEKELARINVGKKYRRLNINPAELQTPS